MRDKLGGVSKYQGFLPCNSLILALFSSILSDLSLPPIQSAPTLKLPLSISSCSLIFFQRMENHLLRNKFNSKKISTQEFIDWALKNRLLRENVDEV